MAAKTSLEGVSPAIPLGNSGVSFKVQDETGHLGYIVINKAYVRWYKGNWTKNKKPCREIKTTDFKTSK